MPSWDQFYAAQVGASVALTGLLFVGISLNMSKILGFEPPGGANPPLRHRIWEFNIRLPQDQRPT